MIFLHALLGLGVATLASAGVNVPAIDDSVGLLILNETLHDTVSARGLQKRTQDPPNYNWDSLTGYYDDEYEGHYDRNLIPDYVIANAPDGTRSRMYSPTDIWEALVRGYEYHATIGRSNFPRAYAGGAAYPHYFGARDAALHRDTVDMGRATRTQLLEYPLIWYDDPDRRNNPGYRPHAWNGDEDPGADRVVFDTRGRYVGVITHRGNRRGDNSFHWGWHANRDGFAALFRGAPGNPAWNGGIAGVFPPGRFDKPF